MTTTPRDDQDSKPRSRQGDGVCPICKIEPPQATEFATAIYTPGVRHDASNRDCPSVLRLSPEAAARLKKRLDALDDARRRAWANAHNVIIGGHS